MLRDHQGHVVHVCACVCLNPFLFLGREEYLWKAMREDLCAVMYVCVLCLHLICICGGGDINTVSQIIFEIWRINTAIECCCGGSKCAMMHNRDVRCTHLIITHTGYPDMHSYVCVSSSNCTQYCADFNTKTHSLAVLFLKPVNRRLNLVSSFCRVL